MTAVSIIRPARLDELNLLRTWLDDAGLPMSDLTQAHMRQMLLADTDGQPVGAIGIEPFGSIGLLRSLVVTADGRGRGIGAALVDALESRAIDSAIDEIWLLTIDVSEFFARLGYTVRDRSDAPSAIQTTAEFSSLCPGDATLMSKSLAGRQTHGDIDETGHR